MKAPIQVIYYFLHEMDRLDRYLEISERLLEEEHDRYLKSLTTGNEKEMKRYRNRRDWSADFTSVFPQYHRRSSLLAFFGMFEENLDHLCHSVRENRKLILRPTALSDKGIDKSRTYLTKVAGWSIAQTTSWANLKRIQKLRNLIAHSSGYLPETHFEEIEKIVEHDNHLSLETGARRRVHLNAEYLHYVLTNIRSYWRTLEKAAPQ